MAVNSAHKNFQPFLELFILYSYLFLALSSITCFKVLFWWRAGCRAYNNSCKHGKRSCNKYGIDNSPGPCQKGCFFEECLADAEGVASFACTKISQKRLANVPTTGLEMLLLLSCVFRIGACKDCYFIPSFVMETVLPTNHIVVYVFRFFVSCPSYGRI